MSNLKHLWACAVLACWASAALHAQNINAYRYWIDDDAANAVTTSVTPAATYTLNTNLATSTLGVGFHKLSIMFRDSNGKWSVITERYFTKSGENMTRYRYWFDDDIANATGVNVTSTATLNLNSTITTGTLAPGLHLVSMQFKNGDNSWSEVTERYFSKTGENMIVWQYWFDDNIGALVETAIGPNATINVVQDIDASAFTAGLHNITWRSKDAMGNWSVPVSQDFDLYTGIAEIPGLESAILMPNPADDHIQLRLDASNADLSYDVIDASGRVVHGSELVVVTGTALRSIDLSSFAPGIYQLRLIGATGVKGIPFVKR